MDPTVGKNDVSVSLSILNQVCQGLNSLMLGMFIPPLVGILITDWYINPYYWVDEFIPCYMEIMEVLTLAKVVNIRFLHETPPKKTSPRLTSKQSCRHRRCQSATPSCTCTPVTSSQLFKLPKKLHPWRLRFCTSSWRFGSNHFPFFSWGPWL